MEGPGNTYILEGPEQVKSKSSLIHSGVDHKPGPVAKTLTLRVQS